MSIDNSAIDKFFGLSQSFYLDKGDMLRYHAKSCAHLMTIVGCDDEDTLRCEPADRKTLPDTMGPLWKFENSWGDKQRFIFATDPWLDANAYSFVVNAKHLTSEQICALGSDCVVKLQPWDV